MRIAGTDLHWVTFAFILIETVFLICLVYYCLTRPKDKNRRLYIVLLFLLIVKNVAMGLFPDPGIGSIPIVVQYVFTYAAGFIMASYFPYYFYQTYNLTGLRFHAVYGIFLFLYLPFVSIFTTEYLLTGKIESAIRHGLYIPAAYSLVLAHAMFRSIQKAFKTQIFNRDYFEVVAIYCSVLPFVAIAFFPKIDQVTEALITNGGFSLISLLFIKNNILNSRKQYEKLIEIESTEEEGVSDGRLVDPETIQRYENNLVKFHLSPREREVVGHVMEGHKYKEIAGIMFISQATVHKHIEKIFRKTTVHSRDDLVSKLTEPS
jgi:DNA-binding CsgD family transcriptional regulator